MVRDPSESRVGLFGRNTTGKMVEKCVDSEVQPGMGVTLGE